MPSRSLFVLVLFALAALCLSGAPAIADPSAIKDKEAQVQDVLGQIQQLDANLERAVEAYNAATDKLNSIRAELRVNARELQIARVNLKRSQRALERRLVTVYTTDQHSSTLGILLGSETMDTMLSQMRDLAAATAFFKQALETVGHKHERVTTGGHYAYPAPFVVR